MYFERNRILAAANTINRVARGKLGRMETVERRQQREIQLIAERRRLVDLNHLLFFSARQIQRITRIVGKLIRSAFWSVPNPQGLRDGLNNSM